MRQAKIIITHEVEVEYPNDWGDVILSTAIDGAVKTAKEHFVAPKGCQVVLVNSGVSIKAKKEWVDVHKPMTR